MGDSLDTKNNKTSKPTTYTKKASIRGSSGPTDLLLGEMTNSPLIN